MNRWIGGILAGCLLLSNVQLYAEESETLSFHLPTASASYSQGDPIDMQCGGMRIFAPQDELLHDISLSISALDNRQVITPSRLLNTTGNNCAGYRLLPSGEHFRSSATLALSYDPYSLPLGYTADDIYTFYYDSLSAQWQQIERIGIDTVQHLILSATNHFTDFINAVVRLPEVPETSGFVPTAMADIPDVDPLRGIPMIAAPTPNSMGTATLTYPIDIPQGRNQLQPDINLYYNHNAGSGMLGVGWSISTPHITIDTRRGVPHFDANYESESYLLNGEPVVCVLNGERLPLPHQNNQFVGRIVSDVEFRLRDGRKQDLIIRYGTNPTNYTWSVTRTDGVTTYYGIEFTADGNTSQNIDENSVVRNEYGCIAYWAATGSIDANGNYIRYQNEKVNNTIYPHAIFYTGNRYTQLAPAYRILFQYKAKEIGETYARLGVLQRDTRLLCNILIQYTGYYEKYRPSESQAAYYMENIAAYYMRYDTPCEQNLFKNRLNEIVKLDSVRYLQLEEICEVEKVCNDGADLNYVIKFRLEEARMQHDEQLIRQLSKCQTEPYGKNGVPQSKMTLKYSDAPTVANMFGGQPVILREIDDIERNRSIGGGAGGTATVGWGPDVATTLLSAGGNFSYDYRRGSTHSMLIDLDGDGLPDYVFSRKGKVYYRKQTRPASFDEPQEIKGINRFSADATHTVTFGAQLSIGYNFNYSHPISNTYTSTYFTNVNGDGLPDLVDDGNIYINHLINGTPTFAEYNTRYGTSIHNSECATMTITGEVDSHIECDVVEVLDTVISTRDYYLQNAENVYMGSYVEDESVEDIEPRYADNTYYEDEYTTPPPPQEYNKRPKVATVSRKAASHTDDLIYRLDHDSVYIYHTETICPQDQTMPAVETVRVWVAPEDGTIDITSQIRLIEDKSSSRRQSRTADGVAYCIQVAKNNVQVSPYQLHSTESFIADLGVINADDYSEHTGLIPYLSIHKGDIVFFRLMSKDNRLYDETQWTQQIYYRTGKGEQFVSDRDFLCAGDKVFQAERAGEARISVIYQNDADYPVKLAVLHNTKFIDNIFIEPHRKDTINVPCFYLEAKDSVIFKAHSPYNPDPVWSDVHIQPIMRFATAYDNIDGGLSPDTLTYHPDLQYMATQCIKGLSPVYYQLFGKLHKGWGQFAYKKHTDTPFIVLQSLYNTQYKASQNMKEPNPDKDNGIALSPNVKYSVDSLFATYNLYNPIAQSDYWIAMTPNNRTQCFEVYGNLGRIGAKIHSNAHIIAQDSIIKSEYTDYDSSVPIPRAGTKAIAVRKHSRTTQDVLSSDVLGIMGGSESWGTYQMCTDYMDMNGDGFPDIVGADAIQYTTPWGGIGQLQSVPNYSKYDLQTYSNGYSFAANSATMQKLTGNNPKDGSFAMQGGSGISGCHGTTKATYSFVDINGDGLPDKIDAVNHTVSYNIGYSFTPPHSYQGIRSQEGESRNESGNLSMGSALQPWLGGDGGLTTPAALANTPRAYSVAQVSISGGVSGYASANTTNTRLMDVNGDRLPDLVEDTGNGIQVYLNYGNGFYTGQKLNSRIQRISENQSASIGAEAAFTAGFTFFGAFKVNVGVHASLSAETADYVSATFMDMNGDGLPDYVVKTGNTIQVYYNKMQHVNLLTTIINPTRQPIQLAYTLSAPTSEDQQRHWQLSDIKTYSDIVYPEVADQTHITYGETRYDYAERTNYGSNYVISEHNLDSVDGRILVEEYHNRHYINHGEKWSDIWLDVNKRPYLRHRQEKRYIDRYSHEETDDLCDDSRVQLTMDGYWTDYYFGSAKEPISTYYALEYDDLHNLITYTDRGYIDRDDDDVITHFTYLHNRAYNMIALPKEQIVTDFNNEKLRAYHFTYNHKGQLCRLIQHDAKMQSDTRMRYDQLGNLSLIIYPNNKNKERMWYGLRYDSITQTYPTTIIDPFKATTHIEYDYRFGLPTKKTDPYGAQICYQYDDKGRLLQVVAPNELQAGYPYTIQYTYFDCNRPLQPDAAYPIVLKETFDKESPTKEVSLYDNRGLLMQTAEWAQNMAYDKDTFLIVTHHYKRDAYGRIILSENTHGAYPDGWMYRKPLEDGGSITTTYKYDILDRPTLQINPDRTVRQYRYIMVKDREGRICKGERIIDENGHYHDKALSASGLPLMTSIIQIGAGSASTYFEYNPLGELIQTEDADGYITRYAYDMFGRCIERVHPDAGTTRWTYDAAGNLIYKQTQKLLQEGGYAIEYRYKYNRLTDIIYPHNVDNDVMYKYDKGGRVTERWDKCGSEEFTYDALGNVSKAVRHILMPTEYRVYSFTMQYQYDSFGKIRSMIYPDGEEVEYRYLLGGRLYHIKGSKDGTECCYLDNQVYDDRGLLVERLLGDGIAQVYKYDDYTQRLSNTYLYSLRDNRTIQDIAYDYDSVGNITRIRQSIADSPFGITDRTYTYDYQYRLVQSYGKSDREYNYELEMMYSPAGRLYRSFSRNDISNFTEIIYGYDRDKITHQPRVLFIPTHSEHTLQLYWDANGNLCQQKSCYEGFGRLHYWDEENRLQMVIDRKYGSYYGYNATGERLYKITGVNSSDQLNGGYGSAKIDFDEATLYPFQYLTIKPRGYTKHYFIGNEHIAMTFGNGGFEKVTPNTERKPETVHESQLMYWFYNMQWNDPYVFRTNTIGETTKNIDYQGLEQSDLQYKCAPTIVADMYASWRPRLHNVIGDNLGVLNRKQKSYFYHNDHLGSTKLVMDGYGGICNEIDYMPFGETFHPDRGYLEKHKFTGKERDEETQYDYFGARYYWSAAKHWLSVDPLSDKYPGISPYAYCGWNPINYVDPNGKWFETAWDIANVALDISSLQSNISQGNIAGALLDGAGLLLDAAAAVLPAIPAGAGTALKAYRAADKIKDATNSGKTIITATQNTYRKALQQATGKVGKGYEAHHTLPQKYRKEFEKLGINIDEPGNVVWRKSEGHRAKSAEHTAEWDEFFRRTQGHPTKEQVMEFRTKTEQRVWPNAPTGDIPVE